MHILTILLLTAAVCMIKSTEAAGSNYKRVCYYTNWSQYRQGDGHFTPQNIEPNLCTHIIFAFAKLVGNDLETIEPNDNQMFKELTALKVENPSLKVTLAVGGWNAGSLVFSKMAATQSSRTSFIQNTIRFLRDHGLDGLDIDWEYPANRGGAAADKQNLPLLLKEMYTTFQQESSKTGNDRLLLSVAVPAGKSSIDSGYDVRTVAQNVDFINLMTYDLHGPWEGKTGENSPLYPKQSETGANAQLNTEWAAKYWNKIGAPKEKIIVGISFFGKTYNLASSADHDVGAQITGVGPAGQYTGEGGVLSYYENCKMQETGGTNYWENEQRVPYYVNGNMWVGYDNVRSIQEKVDFVKSEGFGGIMVWSIDGDDFKKVCSSSNTTYPLLKTIRSALSDISEPDTTKAAMTTRSTTLPSTNAIHVISTENYTSSQQTTIRQTTVKPNTLRSTIAKHTKTTSMPSTASMTSVAKVPTAKLTIQKQSTNKSITAKATGYIQTTSEASTHETTGDTPSSTIQPINVLSTKSKSTVELTSTRPTSSLLTNHQSTTVESFSYESTTDESASTKQEQTTTSNVEKPSTSLLKILSKSSTEFMSTVAYISPSSLSSTIASTTTSASTFDPVSALSTLVPTKLPPKKSAEFSCTSRQDDFYSDPTSCAKFYRCVNGRQFQFTCPTNTLYNSKLNVCDWPYNVQCVGQL